MARPETAGDGEPAAPPRRLGVAFAIAGALTAADAVVGLLYLGRKSLIMDEGVSVTYAAMGWSTFAQVLPRDPNMAAYYVLLRLWPGFGAADAAVRTLSVAAGAAAIPLTFALGARLFGARVGALAAALLTLNAFWLTYAQLARGYVFAGSAAVLSTLLFVRALEQPSKTRWAAYTAATVLAVYCHFFAVFVAAAQWTSLAAARPWRGRAPWAALSISAAVSAALSLPLAYYLGIQDAGNVAWIPSATLRGVYDHLWYLTGSDSAGWAGRSLRLFYAAFALAGLLHAVRVVARGTAEPAQARWRHGLLLAWCAVPVGLAVGVSWLVRPVFQIEYLIVTVPALALLVALGLSRIRPTPALAVVLVLAAFPLARSLATLYASPGAEGQREATQYVIAHSRPGDAIVFYSPVARMVYDHYLAQARAAGPAVAYPTTFSDRFDESQRGDALLADGFWQHTSGHPRVWLYLTHGDGRTAAAIEARARRVVDLAETVRFPEVTLQLYEPHRAGPATPRGAAAASRTARTPARYNPAHRTARPRMGRYGL